MCRAVTFDYGQYYGYNPSFQSFNSIVETKKPILGVVSHPGAVSNAVPVSYLVGNPTTPFDLISLYITAIKTNMTATFTGYYFYGGSTQSVQIPLVANTVTYLPMSNFTNLHFVSIEMTKYTDKYIMDNVQVVQK